MPVLDVCDLLKTKGYGGINQTAGRCPECKSKSWYHWRDDYPGAEIIGKCMDCGHTADLPVKKPKVKIESGFIRYLGLSDLPFEPLLFGVSLFSPRDIVTDTRRYNPRFQRRMV